MRATPHFLLTVVLIVCGAYQDRDTVHAQDWPMWRYDAGRTAAASKNRLPESLQLTWQRSFGSRQQAWDDPLNLDLMTYDRILEPVVMQGRMFVGFNDQCKVMAIDTASGRTLWNCYTEAPVRLPPVGYDGRVYFTSDDGYLYCADAASGEVQWKFRGAPSAQKAIGNRQLTSAWPARGGPVVRDDTIYFAASVWPFMGTFIYALDPASGEVRWVNDNTGAQYIQQPHSAPSFAGVAPQGALVATSDALIVPGGRSVPAVFERATGTFRYFEINAGGKGTGGSFVAATDDHFFVHTREKGTLEFKIADGKKSAFRPSEPVLHDGKVYSAETYLDKPIIRCYDAEREKVWEVDVDGTGDLILAGDELVAAGASAITRLDLAGSVISHTPLQTLVPESTSGEHSGEHSIERLLTADEQLFAVTSEGVILAFANADPATTVDIESTLVPLPVTDQAQATITDLLSVVDAQGFAIWYGTADDAAAFALAADSPFQQLAIVDPNADSVARARAALDAAGVHSRVTVHQALPDAFMAPSYIAHLVVVDHALIESDLAMLAKLYAAVRPFGGVLHVLADQDHDALAKQIEDLKLEQAEIHVSNHGVTVRRVGALPGSADWTHQYGNVANTVKSDDARVKLPLGVLWFGGSSNLDVLPRHGHGPPEQVVGGRLFIQGMNSLSARDVYTGRVLWKRDFGDLGTFDVYYDDTYRDTPLSPMYNQVHIPGANGRGTNYVVCEDRVYLLVGKECHVLDPANGDTIATFTIPQPDNGAADWGYIGVYEDVLIGGVGFAEYQQKHDLSFESDKKLSSSKKGFGAKSFDRAASRALVGMDRHSGEVLWRIDAKTSFWHNGITAGGGQIYVLDRNPTRIEEALQRRGQSGADEYRILAIDHRTGEQKWEVTDGIFGTWLAYSQQFDLLLQAGASASDRLYGEPPKGMAVYRARDGSVKWRNDDVRYNGPCIIHNDLIITNTNAYSHSAGAFYILDGQQKMVPNPVTGEMQPWKLTRAYGCNSIIASENMLTFRSGAAGFYDLKTDSGTGNLGGFKSGCTSNLVAANGVLNAPDYTRTCSCSYQNQTSLALVHMPDMDMWTVNSAAEQDAVGKPIEHLGLNFGAPGDRRDDQGLLWLEYPAVAGPSPPLGIEFNPQVSFVQNHTLTMAGSDLPWVRASGATSVTELEIDIVVRPPNERKSGEESKQTSGEGSPVTAPVNYNVRLLMGAPAGQQATVDVYAQGAVVASDAQLTDQGTAIEFDQTAISDRLQLQFKTKTGTAILQGVELIKQ
jgi:outer membrane protein assembly factor BamB